MHRNIIEDNKNIRGRNRINRICSLLMSGILCAALVLPAASAPLHVFAEISTQAAGTSISADAADLSASQLSAGDEAGSEDAADASGNTDISAPDTDNAAAEDAAETDQQLSAGTDAADGKSADSEDAAADGISADRKPGLQIETLLIGGTVSEEAQAGASIESTPATAKKIKIDDRSITFSKKVIKKSFYGDEYVPQNVKVKAASKKITLSWAAPEKDSFDGYIIVRKNLEQPTEEGAVEVWTELARVDKGTLSYVDTTASTKDTEYRYVVCVYNKTDGATKISHMSDWASGVTTKSSKKNVSSLSLSKPAKTTCVSKGKTVKISPTFPKSPFSKELRWSSSDESKATVSSAGKVKGVKKGTVTISAKMHTGEVFTTKVRVVKPGTSAAMITVMKSWMGYSYSNGKHKGIVDIYNSMTPLPVGYTLKYTDAWCDASVSAAAIVTGCTELTGRECSVPRHITIFKKLGIWEENGKITPEPGDLIIYNWNDSTQPNNKGASHIGIVEKVEDGNITAIEGNKGTGLVDRRVIPVGWGFIRGYARPNYSDR